MGNDAAFDDGIRLDQPPLVFAWTHTFARALAALGREALPLDPRTGGRCSLPAVTFLGLPWEVTLQFAPSDRLVRARFTPPNRVDPKDPDAYMPESLATESRRKGPAIGARRGALESLFGPGEARPGMSGLPCPPARWRVGAVVVAHEVSFNVEREGDPYGWLADRVDITRADDPEAPRDP